MIRELSDRKGSGKARGDKEEETIWIEGGLLCEDVLRFPELVVVSSNGAKQMDLVLKNDQGPAAKEGKNAEGGEDQVRSDHCDLFSV